MRGELVPGLAMRYKVYNKNILHEIKKSETPIVSPLKIIYIACTYACTHNE